MNSSEPAFRLYMISVMTTGPSRGPLFVQVLALGLTFILLGLLSDGTYAVLASYAAGRWRGRERAARVGQRASGAIYVGLGVLAALTPRHSPARS